MCPVDQAWRKDGSLRQFLAVLFLMVMIPYVTTLAWTGRLETPGDTSENKGVAESWEKEESGEKYVIIVQDDKEVSVPVEEFLVHVLAAQIPVGFEPETLKSQAILARTYIYSLMGDRREIYEEELDMDARSREQMERIWGEKEYFSNMAKLQTAVKETAGLYVIHEGMMIEPLFCYASAGKTRSRGEDYPYLKQAESPGDQLAENYRSMPVFELREFVRRINEIPDAVSVSEEEMKSGSGIQIVERDGSGYVRQVQIGQKTYTGEEIQYALGLASPCYSFEYLDGKIRAICKGIGHGYGFAQFGANEMAKEGADFEGLLNYYFQNVMIVSSLWD